MPWWDPRGDCPKNCSFVAGEPSGAFWTLAPAAVTPPQWRVLAYAAALAFGASVGLLRIAGGGHFFSDVVFAGVFTFLVIWLTHGFLYRWRTRIADESVERLIERITDEVSAGSEPARRSAEMLFVLDAVVVLLDFRAVIGRPTDIVS